MCFRVETKRLTGSSLAVVQSVSSSKSLGFKFEVQAGELQVHFKLWLNLTISSDDYLLGLRRKDYVQSLNEHMSAHLKGTQNC